MTILDSIKIIKDLASKNNQQDYDKFKEAIKKYIIDYVQENPDTQSVIIKSGDCILTGSIESIQSYIFRFETIDHEFLKRVSQEEAVTLTFKDPKTILVEWPLLNKTITR